MAGKMTAMAQWASQMSGLDISSLTCAAWKDGGTFLALANELTGCQAPASGEAEQDLQLAFDLLEVKLGVVQCLEVLLAAWQQLSLSARRCKS